MRKNNLMKSAIAASAILAAVPTPTLFAASGETAYPTNIKEDLLITKIVPGESKLELTFKRPESGIAPNYLRLWNGKVSDEMVKEGGMGDMYKYTTTIYDGLTMQLSRDFHTGGDAVVWLDKSNTWMWGELDFNTFAEPIFGYDVMWSDQTQKIGWIDYSRCVEAAAYKRGEATECWLEETGDGAIYYQPYGADGTRYSEEKETPKADQEGNGNPEDKGGAGSSDKQGDDMILTDQNGKNGKDGESGQSEQNSQSNQANQPRQNDVVYLAGMGATSLNGSQVQGDNLKEEKNSDNVSDNVGSGGIADTTTDTTEVVEVPNLGKESGLKMTITIILVMIAAAIAFWFLLFGKKKSKEERKEGEE